MNILIHIEKDGKKSLDSLGRFQAGTIVKKEDHDFLPFLKKGLRRTLSKVSSVLRF